MCHKPAARVLNIFFYNTFITNEHLQGSRLDASCSTEDRKLAVRYHRVSELGYREVSSQTELLCHPSMLYIQYQEGLSSVSIHRLKLQDVQSYT